MLVAAVFALSAPAACTSSSPTSRPATAPTVAAARALLGAHAAALLHRDAQAFRAGLDPSPAAAAFRSAQEADFADLAGVPLAQWSYTVDGAITDARALADARTRYQAPVLIVHAELGYRLRAIDRLPSTHDEYVVVVSRAGHDLLAGDDPLASSGSASWAGPWRYGPLVAVQHGSALVLGPPTLRSRLEQVARTADAATAAVSAVWGTAWSRHVAVVVPATAAAFDQLTSADSREASAAAVTDGIDPVSNTPTGQRIYLNPTQLPALTAVGLGITLRHEITHLATAVDTADITPRWLVEGFAEYVGNLGSGQSVPQAASELAAQVRAGRLPAALPADEAFASTPATVYEQSWLACRLIAAKAGQAGLVRFYRLVGTALDPASVAVPHAFAAVLHETPSRFTAQWRGYLRAELRR